MATQATTKVYWTIQHKDFKAAMSRLMLWKHECAAKLSCCDELYKCCHALNTWSLVLTFLDRAGMSLFWLSSRCWVFSVSKAVQKIKCCIFSQ